MSNRFIKNLEWISAGAGSLVPGYTFFTTYPPPIFPGITLLTGGLAAAVIVITAAGKPLIERAKPCLFIAIISLFAYMLLLRFCTVIEPQHHEERFQVGFWKFSWSLTEAGLNLKEKKPYAPLAEWMLDEGAFQAGGPEIIWRLWSIVTAGVLLVCTYMLGFLLWTAAFSLLAKQKTNPG